MIKLDEIDQQILDLLIEDPRMVFTDIAKKLNISPSTVYVRYKKLEESQLIKGCALSLAYGKLSYSFVAYVGIYLEKQHFTNFVIERLRDIPFITLASVTSGKYNILCKIRVRDTQHTREIIYKIDEIQGVVSTETIISMDEAFNDENRLMHRIIEDFTKK